MEIALQLAGALAQRFGTDPKALLAVLLLVFGFSVLGGAATLVFYWLRSRIAIAEREALAQEQERQTHIASLRQEAQQANARLQAMMNGKLDSLTVLTTETRATLVMIKDSLVSLHDKEEVRAGKVYTKLEDIRVDIAKGNAG